MAAPSLCLEYGDGVFRPRDTVPLSDRGFRYGLALFETLRISRGRALFVREHLEELRRSALESGWWGTQVLPEAALEAAAVTLSGQDTLLPENGVARLHLTAGDGSFTDIADAPRLFLTAEARPRPAAELYGQGIAACFCPHPVENGAPGFKSQNYWAHLTALRQAVSQGYREAVLINHDGELRSFCLGNLFIVRGDRILTPRLESGCHRGVTRQWVLNQLGGMAEEIPLNAGDLAVVDALFLTSSGYGVLPIQLFDGRELAVTPQVHELIEAFQALL